MEVAIGELSAVEPELLRFAWQAVVSEGPDAAAELRVKWHPARQLCPRCGEVQARAAGTWWRCCERCREPLQVEGGDQLDLLRVSFIEEDANEN